MISGSSIKKNEERTEDSYILEGRAAVEYKPARNTAEN